MTITAIFTTDDTTLRHRNGSRVTVVKELTADNYGQEYNPQEMGGPMHLIHFPDGTDTDAFNDELTGWRLSA